MTTTAANFSLNQLYLPEFQFGEEAVVIIVIPERGPAGDCVIRLEFSGRSKWTYDIERYPEGAYIGVFASFELDHGDIRDPDEILADPYPRGIDLTEFLLEALLLGAGAGRRPYRLDQIPA